MAVHRLNGQQFGNLTKSWLLVKNYREIIKYKLRNIKVNTKKFSPKFKFKY